MGQLRAYIDHNIEGRAATAESRRSTPVLPIAQRGLNSWAQVVQRAMPGSRVPLAQHVPETENARKAKQTTIRIDDAEERRQLLGTTLTQLVQTFCAAGGAADSVVGARQTKRGEIILHTSTVEARVELERTEGRATKVCKSARTLRQTSGVAIHGVRKAAVSDKDQGAAIEGLKAANKRLHPRLEIVKVEWPAFAHSPSAAGKEKMFSSLVVEVANPETANRLIDEGIVVEGVLLFCTRWERDTAPRQCFNCCAYRHTSNACTKPTRCGKCAGDHPTDSHVDGPGAAKRCAVCRGEHPAWSRDCLIRQKEVEKTKAKLEAKPKYFNIPERKVTHATSFTAGGRQDAEGFQMVTYSTKRKALEDITPRVNGAPVLRKIGKPTKLSLMEPGQPLLPVKPQRRQQREESAPAPSRDVDMQEENQPPSTQ